MATPTTLPNTPAADGDETLVNFHTSIGHAAGTNLLIHDVLEAWKRIGPGSVNPLNPLFINGTLVASVAGNALTLAVKTLAGTDPSATDPVTVLFRSVTPGSGSYTGVVLTAATSLVISSGSTLGTANSTPFRLWVVAFNDGGTLRLGVQNVVGSGGIINPIAAWCIGTSTAEGGAGGADLAQVFYTPVAATSKAYTILGYMSWESGLGTAGAWSAGPTRIQLADPQTPMPGEVVQSSFTTTGAAATGTTQIPADNSTPQSGEGDQYMSLAIIPQSASNILRVEASGQFSPSIQAFVAMALFQDAGANALKSDFSLATANFAMRLSIAYRALAASVASTTFKIRAGMGAAGTTTFNGQAATAYYNATLSSFIRIDELQG